MTRIKQILVALLICATGALFVSTASAKDTKTEVKKGEKPAASPGWLIIDEDLWYPLRFEPLQALDAAEYHYRRDEETAAADELDKAVSWLNLASSDAMPITQEKLTTAANELRDLASDLRAGSTTSAAKMDASMAKAAYALADWHYYKAKDSLGKSEEADAGEDLEMAAYYLQHAADSAHFQFGPDTQQVITEIYHDGKMTSKTTHFDHNMLGTHLHAIQQAVKELGETMVNTPT